MTPEDSPLLGFDLLPTPDPSKWTVAFTAKIVGRANIATILPTSAWNTQGNPGTTYRQFCEAFKVGAGSNVDQFGTHVFTYAEKAGPGLLTFLFSPPPTTSGETDAPYLQVASFEPHSWPDVLKGLAIDQDSGLPVAQNIPDGSGALGVAFGPTPYSRISHVPGGTFGTRKVRSYYWSGVPRDIGEYPIPVPETISIDLPSGKRVEIPASLHPHITVEDHITASTQAIDSEASAVGSSVPGQDFPATNFEDWDEYTSEFAQQKEGAGFSAVRTVVYPPESPDPIILER